MIEPEFQKLLSGGRIWFGKDGSSQPNVIRYLTEVEGMVPWTWWPSDEVGHTDEAKKEIHGLFGKVDAFDTPKPERLIERIVNIATHPGDLVLDSFAGSGTTGAVAHKMGRRWIMVELGEHCLTHIIPRLKKVIEGTDSGGITDAVNWKGGGGFRYYHLAPSLLEKDKWGNWVISEKFNATMLAEAVCSAFRGRKDGYGNLTVKKIPKAVLSRCEWGKDDYSLKVENLPKAPPPKGQMDLLLAETD